MNDTIDSIKATGLLMEALSIAFGDMAFINVAPMAQGQIASPGAGGAVAVEALVRVAIDVLKPVSCRLEIECPVSLKERVESTLFQGGGARAGESEEDSLLEILNVAAGVFLTSYFGPGADIKLELPEYLFLSDGSEGETLAEASADAEGEPLRAVLRSIRYRY